MHLRILELHRKSTALAPHDWLLQVELLEASEKLKAPTETVFKIESALAAISAAKSDSARHIEDARRTLHLEN